MVHFHELRLALSTTFVLFATLAVAFDPPNIINQCHQTCHDNAISFVQSECEKNKPHITLEECACRDSQFETNFTHCAKFVCRAQNQAILDNECAWCAQYVLGDFDMCHGP